MIPMTLRDLAMLTGGSLHPDTEPTRALVVDGPVVTDSREAGTGSLYVARVGEHADGHAYTGAARDRGAVAALTGRVVDELPCVVVDDVQTAFGRVARGVVDRAPDLTVVAVTGSSGKTSTKDLLAQVLGAAGPTVAPENSLNGEIGVPLTVCRVDADTRFLVAEMGARGIGHLAYLTTIAPPDVSIVLNVGVAHVGEFGSREAVAQAKGELVEALRPEGLAVLNADDAAGRQDALPHPGAGRHRRHPPRRGHPRGRREPGRPEPGVVHRGGTGRSGRRGPAAVGGTPRGQRAGGHRRGARVRPGSRRRRGRSVRSPAHEPVADGGPRARGRRHRRQRRLQRQPRLDARRPRGAAGHRSRVRRTAPHLGGAGGDARAGRPVAHRARARRWLGRRARHRPARRRRPRRRGHRRRRGRDGGGRDRGEPGGRRGRGVRDAGVRARPRRRRAAQVQPRRGAALAGDRLVGIEVPVGMGS